jgi:hypothetical protein
VFTSDANPWSIFGLSVARQWALELIAVLFSPCAATMTASNSFKSNTIMPKTIIAVLLATAGFAIASLASGASYLEAPLLGGLPFGNALAALGLCATAGIAVELSSRGTTLRAVPLAALAAATAWLPASIALAGNLTLNFTDGRGAVWLAFSLAVVAGVTTAVVWALVAALLARLRLSSAA